MQALRDKHVEDSVGLERKVEKLTARVAKGKMVVMKVCSEGQREGSEGRGQGCKGGGGEQ